MGKAIDPVEKLYATLKGRGYYTKSLGDFKKKYSSTQEVDRMFDIVSRDGLYTKSKNEFYGQYFPSIKAEPEYSSSFVDNVQGFGANAVQSLKKPAMKLPPEKDPLIIDVADPLKSVNDYVARNTVYDIRPQTEMSTFKNLSPANQLKAKEVAQTQRQKMRAGAAMQMMNQAKESLFENGKQAGDYLKVVMDKNKGQLPVNNETVRYAEKRFSDFIDVMDLMEKQPDIIQAAVDFERKRNTNLNAQLNTLSGSEFSGYGQSDYNDLKLPEVMQGRLVHAFINNPDVLAAATENPSIAAQIESLKGDKVFLRFPEYGLNYVRNEISREREHRGRNNAIANPVFEKSSYNDKLADELFAKRPELKTLIDKNLKGNWEGKLATHGVVDDFGEAASETFHGMWGSVKDLVGAGDSENERIRKGMEQQYGTVDYKFGNWRDDLAGAAKMAGLITTIAATGNATGGLATSAGVRLTPLAANTILNSVAFYDSELNDWTSKYPGESWKAHLGALLSTAAYSTAAHIVPTNFSKQKVLPEMKGAINDVISTLGEKNIIEGAKAANKTLINKFADVLKAGSLQSVKGAGEMSAITLFKQRLDKVFNLDDQTYNAVHPDGEILDVAKSMILGGMLPNYISSFRNRKAASQALVSIADNPERFKSVLENAKHLDSDVVDKKIQDVDFLAETKKNLADFNVSKASQETYLLNAMAEKYVTEQALSVEEPVLKKQYMEAAQKFSSIKERILKGEDIPVKDDILESNESVAADKEEGTRAAVQRGQNYEAEQMQIPGAGRIKISPIRVEGQSPKNISDILADVSTGLKQKLFFVKPDAKRAIGTYSPGSKAIKLRNSNDLDTAAHEIGHGIDDKYGFLTKADAAVREELKTFSPYGSTPPKNHPDPDRYIAAEGLAEFIRAYTVNPEETVKMAPKTFALYEQLLPDNVKKVISDFSNNVRTLAGATGRDIILSNVEFEPSKENTTVQKILSAFKKDDSFSITWADRLSANFTNPLKPFEKAVEFAKGQRGIDLVLPENDPALLARLMLGYEGKYGEMLRTGMVTAKGQVITDQSGNPKTLEWLLQPLKNDTPEGITENMKDVQSYMIAERTVELSDKFERNDVLTGIGAGLFTDRTVAEKALAEFEALPESRKYMIREAAERYRSLSNDVLKYMVDKGRLSDQQFERIIKDNLQYVALNRILESEPNKEIEVFKQTKRSIGSTTETVHEIKGSSRKIQNPYTSLLDMMHKSVREADRNEVLKNFRDMLVNNRAMYEGMPEALSDVGVKVKESTPQTITVFVNGKPEHWKFQEDVYKALKGYDSDGWRFHPLMTAHARVLRWTVTHFPVFAARNWARDFQDRLIKSNENTGLSGIKNIFGAKEDWREVARAGGLNAGYYMRDRKHYYGLMKEAMKDLSKDGKTIIADAINLKSMWGKYENLLYSGETSNRVAEYRSAYSNAKRKGMDSYNAMLYAADKSRGLIDFAIQGHYMKLINQMIPFSNAAVQGLRSSLKRAAENPTGFSIRIAMYAVLPQIAAWFFNHRDEETAKEYESLPPWQRDFAWNFKIGDNKWLSIPKPFELALPAAGTDRMMSHYAGNEDAYNGYAGSVARSFIPVDESAVAGPFAPFVESLANYDFFRKKPIVPVHENVLDLSLRNNESSSRLALILQNKIGVDARKIDHMIRGQFSYFGDMALKLSNIGDDEKRSSFELTDLGFIKGSPAYNAPAVQEAIQYAKAHKLTSSSGYKHLMSIAEDYFNAKTDEEKQRHAESLRETAERLLKNWKD